MVPDLHSVITASGSSISCSPCNERSFRVLSLCSAVAAGNTLFCSAHDYQAGLWDYGVAFREDSAFEGMFLEAAGNLG